MHDDRQGGSLYCITFHMRIPHVAVLLIEA